MLLPYMYPELIEAGCDEAGRGCLCGPVSCAAVILPPDFQCEELNDSKKLSEAARERLRPVIEEKALAWAVVMVGPEEIDAINILNASIMGMHRALDALSIRPEHILVDGNRFKPYYHPTDFMRAADEKPVRSTTVVKGDGIYMSIAAASILAKTHRDELMRKLAGEFPDYGWEKNMGYPTSAHKDALRRLGPTPHHRRTFKY
ncbi:MAG: ribonuclease HII [Muribaculaceae bacterium]|nr:ribonuclease HII [Muribaculaceae bacterium]